MKADDRPSMGADAPIEAAKQIEQASAGSELIGKKSMIIAELPVLVGFSAAC
jgi:hypothetical protein